jgi:hypothetical protein
VSTNWKVLGSWNVGSSPSTEQPPAIVSLSPAQGAGTAQQFSVTAASPDGAAYLETIELQFQGSGTTNNCEIMYQQSSGLFYLLNDSGTAWSAGAQPGTTATLSNSQCTVSLASTIVLSSGNNLTIEPSVSFSSSFAGTRQIWLYAADQFGEWAGWSHEGNWTIPSD